MSTPLTPESAQRPTPAPRVPLVVAVAAGVGTLFTWLMTLIGSQVTGTSWDEPYRAGKLANLLQHGWFVDNVADGKPVDFNTYVYGPVYDLVSHAFVTALVTQDWSQVSVTADAYAARHLSLALLAAVGLMAVGASAALLLGSWRWGIVATAVLGSIPLWTGHAMFNSSDLPVAVGYSMVTLAIIVLMRHLQRITGPVTDGTVRPRLSAWAIGVAVAVLLAAGAILAIGSRPATWPAVLVAATIAIAGALTLAGPQWLRALGHTAACLATAVVITFVVLALTYPNAFINPWEMLSASVGQSSQFGGPDSADDSLSFATALGYLPSWLAIQLPIGVGVLSVVGIVVALVSIVRGITARVRSGRLPWQVVGIIAIGAQLLLLPLGAAVARSNLYDAGRQFLFIIPALALVATLGVAAFVDLAGRIRRGESLWRALAWLVVGISVIVPVVDQWRLFPYNYTYANETVSALNNELPTDYWRTSMRELLPMIPAEGATACNFDPLVLGLAPIDCANAGQVAPYLDTRGTNAVGMSVPSSKYLFVSSNRGRATLSPETGCTIVNRVTRPLRGEDVVMAYAAVCEAPCVVREAATCSRKSLVSANLDGWNLRGSDFSGADFTGASLILVNFTDANLAGANLTGANVDQANFTNANLDGAVAVNLVGQPTALPPGYRVEEGTLVRTTFGDEITTDCVPAP